MKNTDTQQLLITRNQAAKRYGCSPRSIDNLIRDGILPVRRFGCRFIRIPVEAADKAMLEPAGK
jgi:hypothetical protein